MLKNGYVVTKKFDDLKKDLKMFGFSFDYFNKNINDLTGVFLKDNALYLNIFNKNQLMDSLDMDDVVDAWEDWKEENDFYSYFTYNQAWSLILRLFNTFTTDNNEDLDEIEDILDKNKNTGSVFGFSSGFGRDLQDFIDFKDAKEWHYTIEIDVIKDYKYKDLLKYKDIN